MRPAALARVFLIGCLAVSALPLRVRAQGANDAPAPVDGILPDADFRMMYEKHTSAPAEFRPLYSWDAWMQLDATVFRKAAHSVNVTADIQSVGTENLHGKVSVGAAGYILGFSYARAFDSIHASAGFQHLSSHLTRDLDERENEIRAAGGTIPYVSDPTEYNIVYIKADARLKRAPFTPRLTALAAPFAFRFNGSPAGEVRRLYIRTEWTLRSGRASAIVAETQHEVGSSLLDTYGLRLDLLRHHGDGRMQLFVTVAPGHELHVSPIAGAVLDGVAAGARIAFESAR